MMRHFVIKLSQKCHTIHLDHIGSDALKKQPHHLAGKNCNKNHDELGFWVFILGDEYKIVLMYCRKCGKIDG